MNYKDTIIKKEMIEAICKAQERIFTEDSRHLIENYCREDQVHELMKDIKKYFIEQKMYYKLVQTMLLTPQFKDKEKEITSMLKDTRNLSYDKNIRASKDLTTLVNDARMSIPGLKSLTDFIFLKQPKLIDIFTFSIIPSYFEFFWSNPSIDKLVEFFFLIQQDPQSKGQYDALARIAFLTPGFLRFAEYGLQPFFSSFLNSSEKKGFGFKKYVVDRLNKIEDESKNDKSLENVYNYNFLIPKETFVVLCCSSEPIRTLRESFFKYALQSQYTAHLYNLFHFSQNPKEFLLALNNNFPNGAVALFLAKMIADNHIYEKINNTVNSLNQKLNDSDIQSSDLKTIIKDLSSSVDQTFQFNLLHDGSDDDDDYNAIYTEQNNTSEYNLRIDQFSSSNFYNQASSSSQKSIFMPIPKLFSYNDCEVFPEIFQPLFISTNDLSLFNLYNNKAQSFKETLHDQMKYYLAYNENEQKRQNDYAPPELTMGPNYHLSFVPHLRHLLQLTDKLPVFNDIPPEVKTLHDFFEIYLVRRGDIRTYKKRKINSDNFFGDQRLNLPNDFYNAIKEVGFTREKDLRALSAFSFIEPRAIDLKAMEEESMTNLINIFESMMYDSYNKINYVGLKKYIKNPNNFYEEYNKIFISVPENFLHRHRIAYEKLCIKIGLNFTSFVEELNKGSLYTSLEEKYTTFFSKEDVFTQFINQENAFKIKNIIGNGEFDQGTYFLKFVKSFQPNYYQSSKEDTDKHRTFVKEQNMLYNSLYPVNDIKFSEAVSEILINGFLEDSILRKIRLISIAYSMIVNEIKTKHPKGKALDEDEVEPIIRAILIRLNPPQMLANTLLNHYFRQSEYNSEIFDGQSNRYNLTLIKNLNLYEEKNPDMAKTLRVLFDAIE